MKKKIEDSSTPAEVRDKCKPNLQTQIFSPRKNMAFALIKEFFAKFETDQMTDEHLSNLLNEDFNNMFKSVNKANAKN